MLDKDIVNIKGIGPKKAQILKNEASIKSIEDVLYYIPRKYIDRSAFKSIKDCFVNETVTVAGTIKKISLSGRRRRFLQVEINDGTESLSGIFFGGVQFFQRIFSAGDFVFFSGKISCYNGKQIVHPEFDFIDNESILQLINTGRIIPLYGSTEALKGIGFDSRGFRRLIRIVVDEYLDYVVESIDREILERHNLIGIKEALLAIHFPVTFEQAERARKRLAFTEVFFLLFYLSLSKRYTRENHSKIEIKIDETQYNRFIDKIPFQLTGEQEKAIEDIKGDITSPYPMNRLLQGDVGTGKTVVAMASSLLSTGMGLQAAFMAPTEVLAVQHYNSFITMLPDDIRITLLTGSLSKSEKAIIYKSISNGEIDIAIGTHSLIQEAVSFKKLGLIIIDEQQRFGVDQRARLRKKGEDVDLLIMTATPIPRSLSMTLYGDLDVSYIRTKLSNRLPVKTLSFPESRLNGVYNSIEKYIESGRQVYYILPLIEESEKIDLKSAEEVYKKLKNSLFVHRNVELLHGRINQPEKDMILNRFYSGKIDILVSTTIIEVGIDVPNASLMVVEHPERFGLSQLHQLRGRVGRGEHQSYCILIYPDNISEDIKNRIKILVSTDDGFKISEEDLKIRGAGHLSGVRQHGHSGDFKFTDLLKDIDIIDLAREEAERETTKVSDIQSALKEMSDNKYISLIGGIRS